MTNYQLFGKRAADNLDAALFSDSAVRYIGRQERQALCAALQILRRTTQDTANERE